MAQCGAVSSSPYSSSSLYSLYSFEFCILNSVFCIPPFPCMQVGIRLHTMVCRPSTALKASGPGDSMLRFLTAGLLIAGTAGIALAGTTTGASNVTFNKDVLPILQKNCQTCHRPGEIGPMAVSELRRHASLGQGHQAGRPHQEDAALVRRSRATDISRMSASWATPTSKPWWHGWTRALPRASPRTCPRPSSGPKAGTSSPI